MRLRGVLLDVDGTLLDSNVAHASSFVDALTAHGWRRPPESVLPLIGMGGDRVIEILGLDPKSDVGKAVLKDTKRIFKTRYLPGLFPFPGARELLLRMRQSELRLVVASSAARTELDALLDAARVRDLVDDTTSADDAAEAKPAPDIVHAAIAKARLPADELILLGDTPYDVEAGRRAGVRVVAVRSGGWSDAALRGASRIYADVAELLARYDESPFTERPAG
ncbi:MAG TPA: HAD family hydrolase [Polyangiaceae bacterium]|nr:HAD family hydrolase [Polyangiaceae bacterium]